MESAKMKIPVALMSIVAIWMILEYFIPFPEPMIFAAKELRNFTSLVLAGSMGLGIVLFGIHNARRIAKKEISPHYIYNIVFFVALFITLGTGLMGGRDQPQFDWIFTNLYSPIRVALYSTTAFFITSAGFRVFRARNLDAGILLGSGTIVLLMLIPMVSMNIPFLTTLGEWIQNVPGAAGFRGFIIGVALGTLAIGTRILLGRNSEALR